jgi:hypothetical protein
MEVEIVNNGVGMVYHGVHCGWGQDSFGTVVYVDSDEPEDVEKALAMTDVPNDVLRVGFRPGYERDGLYSLHEVFENIGDKPVAFGGNMFGEGGDLIEMNSHRYVLFKRSQTCVCCGLTGTYFAKERSAKKNKQTGEWVSTDNKWHFNLYARREDGTEVLMTKDHIQPKSKGGADEQDNYATMCSPCNGRKKDKVAGT